MTVMGAAYVTYLVWAGMGLAAASEHGKVTSFGEATAAQEAIALPAGFAGLELLYAMPAPPAPKTVAVTSSVGVCPRGLLVGDFIEIDEKGHLSLPLCRTAVEALAPLLQSGFDGGTSESRVGCISPKAGRHLTFSVGPATPVGVK